ncbi:sensor histidine kinase [Thiothrix eikelboomii]|uniref:sensor histidine kinase n=1 Tax=Thiothrix eikelboomii TaxID=92487 RepID=UPI003BB0D8E2
MKIIDLRIPARLGVWPIMLLVGVCLVLGWQITTVRYQPPAEGALSRNNATVVVADPSACPASISDGLATADIVVPLAEILGHCVRQSLAQLEQQGKAVILPHEWRDEFSTLPALKSGQAVYRVKVSFSTTPQGLWSLVLPTTGNNPAILVNDRLIGWGGSFQTPVARNTNRPLMFTIPQGLLIQGDNYFDIYVVSEPAATGFLDRLVIGRAEVLEASYQRYHFFRSTLPQIIALVVLVLSCAMGMLWFYRRQDREYGFCALGGVFWSIYTLDQFVVNIAGSYRLWDWLSVVSLGGLSLIGVFFIHRFLQQRYPRTEQSLLISLVGLALLLAVVPEAWFYGLLRFVAYPVMCFSLLYVLLFAAHAAWQVRSADLYVLVAAGSVVVLLAFYDLMVIWGFESLAYGRFLHFGAPFVLLAFGWILLQRFVRSLQAMESFNAQLIELNQELEARVEEKTRKIAQSYETIRILGQEQVLLHERSRIMRDMHDGIGVYLTSMLRQLENDTVDRQQLSHAAHHALNDLRLMIDSLGSASTDLPAMLGMFRTRIGVALEACGVDLEWNVDELPPLADFGPERALNLLRILQEAFTNALKHSSATCIRLSAKTESKSKGSSLIIIEVCDNGKGFNLEGRAGNGLKNMRYRAQKIKAEFAIKPSVLGTCLEIGLPLPNV